MTPPDGIGQGRAGEATTSGGPAVRYGSSPPAAIPAVLPGCFPACFPARGPPRATPTNPSPLGTLPRRRSTRRLARWGRARLLPSPYDPRILRSAHLTVRASHGPHIS